jgi:hypothetical protein
VCTVGTEDLRETTSGSDVPEVKDANVEREKNLKIRVYMAKETDVSKISQVVKG